MKPLLRGLIAAALLAAAPVQLACGGSDENSTEEQVREVEIVALAAYACMPGDLRRELRSLEKRHENRLRELARASIPKGATGAGPTAPPGFQQTVLSDPVRKRLLSKARAIYVRYSPGGKDYDASCFLREREEARNQIENQ